jgi:hypothetical protein
MRLMIPLTVRTLKPAYSVARQSEQSLPIAQPSGRPNLISWSMVTAKALVLTMPPVLSGRADVVIE